MIVDYDNWCRKGVCEQGLYVILRALLRILSRGTPEQLLKKGVAEHGRYRVYNDIVLSGKSEIIVDKGSGVHATGASLGGCPQIQAYA